MRLMPMVAVALAPLVLGPSAQAASDGSLLPLSIVLSPGACWSATVLFQMPHGHEWGAKHGNGHQTLDWTVSYVSGGAAASETLNTRVRDVQMVWHSDRGHTILAMMSACLEGAPDPGSPAAVEIEIHRGS